MNHIKSLEDGGVSMEISKDELTNIQKHGENMKKDKSTEGFCNYTYSQKEKEWTKLFIHLRAMKHINRLSSVPLIKSYSLAEHCYYTGILFEAISKEERIHITKEELSWVYKHDVMESITGDVLRPAKNHSDKVKKLWESIEHELVQGSFKHLEEYTDFWGNELFTRDSWKLWNACDLFELFLFCSEEWEMGNHTHSMETILENVGSNLVKHYDHLSTIKNTVYYWMRKWVDKGWM